MEAVAPRARNAENLGGSLNSMESQSQGFCQVAIRQQMASKRRTDILNGATRCALELFRPGSSKRNLNTDKGSPHMDRELATGHLLLCSTITAIKQTRSLYEAKGRQILRKKS